MTKDQTTPKDPNEIVEAVAHNGSLIYRSRRVAESFGLTIREGRRATNGLGQPLPTKPKINISSAAKAKPASARPAGAKKAASKPDPASDSSTNDSGDSRATEKNQED